MARTITIEIQRPTSHVVEVGIERGAPKLLQSKTVTPTTQQQTVTPDSGYYGLNEVTVNAAPTQPLVVTPSRAQQIINPDSGYVGFEEVTVNPVTLQDKTVTPTEQVQVVEADDGYDGLNQVTVNPIAYPDLSWIMEAKVGNHPVVTAADMRKILSYIALAHGGNSLLRYAPVTSIDFSEVDDIGAWGLAMFAANNSTLTSATFPALETVNKERALYYAFAYDTALTSVSFPNLETVSGSYAMYQLCYNDTSLTSASFPSLKTVSEAYALADAFHGCTNLVSVTLSALETITGSYAMSYALSGSKITSLSMPSLTTINGSYAAQYMCYNCTSLTSVDLSGLQTISGQYAAYYMFAKSSITSIIIGIDIMSADYGLNNTFENCASLLVADFPNLTNISTNTGIQRTFTNCTQLQKVKLPKLSTISGNNGMPYCFNGCTALFDMEIYPSCLRFTPVIKNPISSATYLRNIELTADASTNLYFSWQGSLTFDTVKHILSKCNNANMNGKSVTFKSGLTITDDAEGSLAALKTAVTAQGCTINNLTINPYTP